MNEPKQGYWTSYNLAQKREMLIVQRILYSLLGQKIKENKGAVGRPKLPLRDQLFCMIYRVYLNKSARRINGFLDHPKSKAYLRKIPSFSSLCRYYRDEENIEPLLELLEESSKPLKDYEDTFAADATGFGTGMYTRWFSHYYSKKVSTRGFIKANVMVGVKSLIITAAIVTKGTKAECTDFPKLVKSTAKNFKIKEVSADCGYLSDYNLQAVEQCGGTPYILFRRNCSPIGAHIHLRSNIWKKMINIYTDNKEYFMKKYHKRSNVESAFSSIKRKLNASLRSKDKVGQKNELLCNLIAHNLIILVHQLFESDLDIEWLN